MIARKAASKVAAKWRQIVTYDDLCQEAAIILASNPDAVRGYVDRNELGFLFHWLWCRLTDIARSEAAKKNREVSFEEKFGRPA